MTTAVFKARFSWKTTVNKSFEVFAIKNWKVMNIMQLCFTWDGSIATSPSEYDHSVVLTWNSAIWQDHGHVEIVHQQFSWTWHSAIRQDHGHVETVHMWFSCKTQNEHEHKRFCKQFCKQAIATCNRGILQCFRVKVRVKWWCNEINGEGRGTYLVKTYHVKTAVAANVFLKNHFIVTVRVKWWCNEINYRVKTAAAANVFLKSYIIWDFIETAN